MSTAMHTAAHCLYLTSAAISSLYLRVVRQVLTGGSLAQMLKRPFYCSGIARRGEQLPRVQASVRLTNTLCNILKAYFKQNRAKMPEMCYL